MKPIRQLTAILACLLCVTSCGEEEKKPAAADKPRKDSIITVEQANPVNPYASVDRSPMDMSYFPVDYPKLKMANHNAPPPVARIVYSRPQLQGRHLFNQVLKYGEPWRLGANESTEIQFFRDVTIQDKKVKAGRYIMYCIPEAHNWTIVLNTNIDSWGLKQDAEKDVHRFTVPAVHDHASPSLEYFTIVFEKTGTGANIIMAWGDITARLPIVL